MSTKELVLSLWMLILTVAIFMVFAKSYQTPAIVSIDLQRSVKQFSHDLSTKKLPDDEKNKLTKEFSQRLVSVTESYASSHHVVIVVSPAVVSGARDVTQEIQHDIYRALSSNDER